MFKRFLDDETVEERYVQAGSHFGNAVSYLYMGECHGFTRMLGRWEKWEKEYARRGFRTISLDVFEAHGGYGAVLEGLGEKLVEMEEPVFHAKIYRERLLGEIQAVFNPWELMERAKKEENVSFVGEYELPSTRKTL